MDKKKRVYGYCRVSTVGQALDGDSIDAQEQKIVEYCKMKNLELISIHKELGVSGAIPPRQRPQLNLILANLDAGNGTGFVVCKIDRLSRSTKDFINLMSEIKDKYDFYSIVPDMDSSTTIGKFTMNLLSIISELELSMIKDRVKEVMSAKKIKNEVVGSIPFGKRVIKDSNILEDDPEEQKTIIMAKELRNEKKLIDGKIKVRTLKEICKELESKGRKNKEGQSRFFPSQIRRMIYEGEYKTGRKRKAKTI